MKFFSYQKRIAIALLIIFAGFNGNAAAKTLAGSLGSAAGAADFYKITCNVTAKGPPAYLQIGVRDELPAAAPLISVQSYKVRIGPPAVNIATNTTDAGVDGNIGFSPLVSNNAGSGIYLVMVNKSNKGAENYTLGYSCKTKTGVITDSNPPTVRVQNQ